MAPALSDDVPPDSAERSHQLVARDDRKPAAHAGKGNFRRMTPVEATTLLAEPLDVKVERLLPVRDRLVERVALRVQAWKIGRIGVVAALFLRREDKLNLFVVSMP